MPSCCVPSPFWSIMFSFETHQPVLAPFCSNKPFVSSHAIVLRALPVLKHPVLVWNTPACACPLLQQQALGWLTFHHVACPPPFGSVIPIMPPVKTHQPVLAPFCTLLQQQALVLTSGVPIKLQLKPHVAWRGREEGRAAAPAPARTGSTGTQCWLCPAGSPGTQCWLMHSHAPACTRTHWLTAHNDVGGEAPACQFGRWSVSTRKLVAVSYRSQLSAAKVEHSGYLQSGSTTGSWDLLCEVLCMCVLCFGVKKCEPCFC